MSGDDIVLSSRVGRLHGHLDDDGHAWTTTDVTHITGPWDGAWGDLLHVLGRDQGVLAEGAEAIATKDGVVAIEAKDVKTLDSLRPDTRLLSELAPQGVEILCVWARRGRAYGTDWHQRVFAPHYGIEEDPVTGMACARMANILYAHGRLKTMEGEPLPDGTIHLKARQGDAVGRRGIVKIRLEREGDIVTKTRIGGRAVVAIDGRIRLP